MKTKQNKTATASACGKLIISGEHAVVFGAPALAMGTRCRVRSDIESTDEDRILFDIPDLDVHLAYTSEVLRVTHDRIAERYERFLDGGIGIDQVLPHPVELIPFAFSATWAHLGYPDTEGLKISLDFGIPIGCGLGSSAAVGISLIQATGRCFDSPLSASATYELSMTCERLMHGHPSGVDSNVSLYGGAFHFQNGQLDPRPLPDWQFQLYNSGRPESTTGECVESVRSRFTRDNPIWREFSAVTEELDSMIREPNPPSLHDAIRANHELLCRIGVVPERIQKAVRRIESMGGAAKITGAGAVHGENAGALMVFGDVDPGSLSDYCIEPIEGC